MESANVTVGRRVPWNKGKLTGQKLPLKLGEIWAIRTRLQMASNFRELAIFNLAIDGRLRACDLTRLQVQDIRLRWLNKQRFDASCPASCRLPARSGQDEPFLA